MSSNLVIVAIPDENDRVWKVSSEKVPHLTLLFLGDMDNVANVDQIIQFVEHAANQTLRRFYLPVDRRGELGADQADVLFFKKGRYDYKAIRDFRVTLLKDHNIRTAYDSATQFDGPWEPHLTLGYPATPAKPDDTDRDFGFYDVAFNKIAVWTEDFDGPEFLLKDYWDEWEALENVPMDVAMSALRHVSETPWSDYSKSDYTLEQWHAACLIHTHEGEATSKSECKLPVKTPDGALNRNGVHAAAAALAGARGGLKNVSEDQKKKAANALKRYYAQLDEEPPESLAEHSIVKLGSEFVLGHYKGEMAHAIDRGTDLVRSLLESDSLEHYGVKGMRWGVRKKRETSAKSQVDTGLFRRKTKIQTEGGESHPAHDDAVKVARAQQKLKKSGTAALSNQELREVANRIQLEEQVKGLMTSRGRKFVRRQVEQTGQQQLQKSISVGVKKVGPRVVKKAGKAATVAALL
jgi:2'-5' RNA ligase